jgi:hypothetical protein
VNVALYFRRRYFPASGCSASRGIEHPGMNPAVETSRKTPYSQGRFSGSEPGA